jgi:serine/threonine-protein kinase
VLEGMLAGLTHAEANGIVHRDLKPENLMVTADGRVKIADFGIAKATTKSQTGAFLTATGTTVGTPTYMAPEQAMAQDIGPWTDLYSVGCMAFELFTGNVPFHDSDAPMAILLRHVNESIAPVKSLRPEVDQRISDWIEKLLVKDPGSRTQNAQDAWDDFEEILLGLLGPRWRRDARLVAANLEERPAASHTTHEFKSFAWDAPTPDANAPPMYTPPPSDSTPSIPEPVVGPPTPVPDTGFVTFGSPAPAPPTDAMSAPASPPPPAPPASPVLAPVPGPPPEPIQLPGRARREPLAVAAPLNGRFEYLHGPLVEDEGGIALLGKPTVVETLKERLRHSSGGSFLITGFRGVGKTTVVLRALAELEREDVHDVEFLPIVLNVARPTTIDQLLFAIVRRLFEALGDRGVLDLLGPDARNALEVAYSRTSLTLKETASHSREQSQTLGVDLGLPGAPKLGATRKRGNAHSREASYLAYSHADAEHDFLRVIGLLDPASPVRRNDQRRRFRRRRGAWRGRLVVVLDELDKLTATEDGVAAVDELLMGLKNLLTARNAHFVFVGGPELPDAFMRDVARGNSVYESVFACHVYVPCLWGASRQLVESVVEEGGGDPRLDGVIDYFDYKSRGIPRLLLRELNALVRWSDGRASLVVDDADAARVAFYADIQSAVTEFVETPVGREPLSMPIDRDRWRLGAYYITDWILRRGTLEFTAADILADDATPSPLLRASADRVEKLLGHLHAHRILDRVWYQDEHQTVIGDAPQANSFRVTQRVIDELAAFARHNELERAELGGVRELDGLTPAGLLTAADPWATSLKLARVQDGRYELGPLIAVGGVSRVHKAFDRELNREVAIKLLAPQLLGDAAARGRWRREAGIATQLEHEHIVRTFDVLEDGELASGLVMEYIKGPTLRDVLPLKTPAAVRVIAQLLSALTYAADFELARFDVKPENVVFRHACQAVIVDLGLVKPVTSAPGDFNTVVRNFTRPLVLGTPAYMSPEQARGAPLDIRSDLYCVGLVLYETIVGRPLRRSRPNMTARVLAALDVSAALRAVLSRALAESPEDRFAAPEEMYGALLATPEGIASRSVPDNEVLLPRSAQPARGRLAVLPAVGRAAPAGEVAPEPLES